jgi:putative phosphoribosyl transferase
MKHMSKRTAASAEANRSADRADIQEQVKIPINDVELTGDFVCPAGATGLVVFAHGSGSSRLSPRNQFVAGEIQAAGMGTLLFDLLTPAEESKDVTSGVWRFDIPLLTRRLVLATRWLTEQDSARGLGVGYFGSSTGAAAALVAAAQLGSAIQAVVSRGGRPDFAGTALPQVTAPTLFIVGEYDEGVLSLNWSAYSQIKVEKQFLVVPRATHLFEEPGALEEVANLARDWFRAHLRASEPT